MSELSGIRESDPRIHYCETKSAFLDEMTESDSSPFKQKSHLMQFCACYAIHAQGRSGRLKLEKRAGDLKSGAFDQNLINYIGAYDQQSLESFKHGVGGLKERILIFEEYANHGLSLVHHEQVARTDTSLTEFFLQFALEAALKDEDDNTSTDLGSMF